MAYMEIQFRYNGVVSPLLDALPAVLAEIGFQGFLEEESGMKGYVPLLSYHRQAVSEILKKLGLEKISFQEAPVQEKNWNSEWESNFEPVVIQDQCLIRAPFHPDDTSYPYRIIIEPKMSFGTGHHETTALMISEMLTIAFKGSQVWDAGCGTGILSVLAEQLGARNILALDNDPVCCANALENIRRNHCSHIRVELGDASSFKTGKHDLILANIGLNLFKTALPHFIDHLRPGGMLILSGILTDDLEEMKKLGADNGLRLLSNRSKGKWALIRFIHNR